MLDGRNNPIGLLTDFNANAGLASLALSSA
jgi:hypothetical protein